MVKVVLLLLVLGYGALVLTHSTTPPPSAPNPSPPPTISCPEGQYLASGSSMCAACPNGRSSPAGSTSAASCSPSLCASSMSAVPPSSWLPTWPAEPEMPDDGTQSDGGSSATYRILPQCHLATSTTSSAHKPTNGGQIGTAAASAAADVVANVRNATRQMTLAECPEPNPAGTPICLLCVDSRGFLF